jgi:hypothetical protein
MVRQVGAGAMAVLLSTGATSMVADASLHGGGVAGGL